jgi:hypothetical protein
VIVINNTGISYMNLEANKLLNLNKTKLFNKFKEANLDQEEIDAQHDQALLILNNLLLRDKTIKEHVNFDNHKVLF